MKRDTTGVRRTRAGTHAGRRALVPLLGYLRPHRWALFAAALGLVLGSLLGFFNLLLLKPTVEVLGGETRSQRILTEELVTAGGARVTVALHDDGKPPDEQAGDGLYSAWLSAESGQTSAVAIVKAPRAKTRATGSLHPAERAWERLIAPVKSRLAGVNTWLDQYALSNRRAALWWIALAMLGLAAAKSLVECSCQYLLARACYGMVSDLHEELFRKIIAQDYLFFVRQSTGYLESRIQSDVAALRRTLETLLRNGFQAPFQLLFLGLLLLGLNFRLTLLAAAVSLLALGPLLYLSRVVRRVVRETRRQADLQSAGLEESLRNFPVVKFFQSESFEIEKFAGRNRELLRCYLKNRLAQFGSAPLTQLATAAGRSAVILAGGYLLFAGQMEFSMLVVYLVALTRFYGPGRSLSRAGSTWPNLIVSAERMAEILRLQPAVCEVQDALSLERVRDAIEFRNVSFSYAEVGQIGNLSPSQADSLRHVGQIGNLSPSQADSLRHSEALDNVSFRVPVGRIVALVGPSGAGKTTLACLLARLFDPTSGSIEIDGTDLRRYRLADLRRAIAAVTQDTILFNDTVARNIAYPDARPDVARVIAAARAAHAEEFITALDGGAGYETVIGQSGQRLSGGQRQRLAIARALYRNPQILVFDEATSSLDEESQALVQQAIQNLFRGRTVFIIAHRLSTVRRADEILVLSRGRLVEQGSHEELLRANGFYASLCRISEGEPVFSDEF
jgi:ABC-type multidrug transport system fused ATPase/permease subunit